MITHFGLRESCTARVICKDGYEFLVHKDELCGASFALKQLFNHAIKDQPEPTPSSSSVESLNMNSLAITERTRESRSKEMIWLNADARAVGHVLKYIYEKNYEDAEWKAAIIAHRLNDKSACSRASLSYQLCNVAVYELAHKLELPGLQTLALYKFSNCAWRDWNGHFIQIAEAIYKTTPSYDRGMRDLISSLLVSEVGKRRETESQEDQVSEFHTFRVRFQEEELKMLFCAVPEAKNDMLREYIMRVLEPMIQLRESSGVTSAYYMQRIEEAREVIGRDQVDAMLSSRQNNFPPHQSEGSYRSGSSHHSGNSQQLSNGSPYPNGVSHYRQSTYSHSIPHENGVSHHHRNSYSHSGPPHSTGVPHAYQKRSPSSYYISPPRHYNTPAPRPQSQPAPVQMAEPPVGGDPSIENARLICLLDKCKQDIAELEKEIALLKNGSVRKYEGWDNVEEEEKVKNPCVED